MHLLRHLLIERFSVELCAREWANDKDSKNKLGQPSEGTQSSGKDKEWKQNIAVPCKRVHMYRVMVELGSFPFSKSFIEV